MQWTKHTSSIGFNSTVSFSKWDEKQQQRHFKKDIYTTTITLTQPIWSFHGLLGLFCPKPETFSVTFFHFGSNPRAEESLFV